MADQTVDSGQQARPGKAKRRILIVFAVAVALLACYALAGYKLVPWLIKRELPKYAAKELQHQARVSEVRFDPFRLEFAANDLSLADTRGGALISIKHLAVKLDWASITRRAWSFAHVRIGEPRVNLEISQTGRLNFADLIDALNREPPDPDKRLPRMLLEEVKVTAGRVDFNDRQAGVSNALAPIDFQLADLSTLPEHNGQHTLTARTANGGSVRWKGTASLTPIAGSGEVVVEALALAALQPYFKDYLVAVVTDGRLALRLPYGFAYAGGKVGAELKKASVNIESLAVTHAGGAPLITLPSVAIEGVDAILKTRKASIAGIKVAGGRIAVKRDAKGEIDLAALVKPVAREPGIAPSIALATTAAPSATVPAAPNSAAAPVSTAPDPGWEVVLQSLRVDDFSAEFADASAAQPLGVVVGKIGLMASAGLAAGVVRASVATLGLADIALGPRAAPPIRLASLNVSGATLDLGARSLAVERVALGPIAAKVAVDDKGRVDLLDMLPTAATQAKAAAPAAAPFAVTVSAVDFERVTLDVNDRSNQAQVAAQIARAKVGSITAGTGVQVKSVEFEGVTADAMHPAAQVRAQGARLRLAGLNAEARQPGGLRVASVDLGGMVADIDARALGLKLRAEDVRARLTDLTGDPKRAIGFDAGLRLREGGVLSARGKAVAATGAVDAEVKVEQLALAIAQPFIAKVIRLKIASGTASAQGRLAIGGDGPWLRYTGAAGVADLLLNEEDGKQFAALKFGGGDGMDVQLKPDAIEIPELRLDGPQAQLFIDADRTLNAVRLLVAAPAGAPPGAPSGGSAAPSTTAAGGAGPPPATAAGTGAAATGLPPIALRRVRINDGKLDFQDLSLRPQFGAKIHELNGVITGLSTSPSSRSRIELDGRVDEFGSARIRGELNPFFPRLSTDVAMVFRNVDMTTATPYAMKFAGYRIASGRISLDLGYKVRENRLEGDNKVVIDQLTLGERVDSPDAIRLPLALAIAVLKDSDGRIDLGLPISGSLDDPQFSYGALVWKAVVNVLTRVVTAPFRALGSLFGGDGARLEAIAFEGGSAQVAPPEREKLRQVAQVLAKRPQLKLAIPAGFDEALDAPALRERAARVEILRRAGLKLADGESPGPLDPQDRAQRAALREIFVARHGAPALEKLKDEAERGTLGDTKSGKPQAPPVWRRAINMVQGEPQVADPGAYYGAIAERLSASQPLPADALAKLASERAATVTAALREAGVDAARIAAGKPQPDAGGGKQVELKLGLDAR
ncbi:MAG: DUF748 domain-containing protein [Burkholderiales bacterium]